MSANFSVKPGCEGFTTLGTTDANGRRIGVLLSHGFTGSVVSMKPWADHLDRLGFALSVPRLPGHGTSLEDMINTRFSDYYAAVESAYEELAARSDIVFVGGLSMGGGLALWLAANHPEIGGVMLVNAAVASNKATGAQDHYGRSFASLAPLAAPFCAIRVTGAIFHTQGGLMVDENARVLREDGTALPNVFAGGGAARSISGPEVTGYLPAMGLCMAITLGRVAGRSAATQRH